jgi:hypothetical protein
LSGGNLKSTFAAISTAGTVGTVTSRFDPFSDGIEWPACGQSAFIALLVNQFGMLSRERRSSQPFKTIVPSPIVRRIE